MYLGGRVRRKAVSAPRRRQGQDISSVARIARANADARGASGLGGIDAEVGKFGGRAGLSVVRIGPRAGMIAARVSVPVRLAWEVVRPDGSYAGSW
jgi:hypothetical protein